MNNQPKKLVTKIPFLVPMAMFIIFLFGTVRVLLVWIEEEKLAYLSPIDYSMGFLVVFLAVFSFYSFNLSIKGYREYKKISK